MMRLWLLLVVSGVAAAAPAGFEGSGFEPGSQARPRGWTVWTPRAELAPRAWVDAAYFRRGPGSLALTGNRNAAAVGGWEAQAAVEAGQWYRLTAHYRAAGATNEQFQILTRLDWQSAAGKRAGQPEYAYRVTAADAWRTVTVEAPAPAEAAAVKIQLLLQNAPEATVWWDEISLDRVAAPPARPVTVASINLRPARNKTSAENIRQFIEAIDRRAPAKTDLVVLPEGATQVGTGKAYVDVAESVPGPTTAMLSEAAKRRKTYIVAGLYEREGGVLYNTAVLIDREGRVAGKYRKVYLPREEVEAGLTPGNSFPVFDTDFGKMGMMICWDAQYADPARALALNGAELIALPIWGGSEALVKARAIENQVFVVASGYDYPTHIVDPKGEVLAAAPERDQAATATVDLNRRYVDPWLGHMKSRFQKEIRLDLAPALR